MIYLGFNNGKQEMKSGGCKTLYITLAVIAVLEHLRMDGAF